MWRTIAELKDSAKGRECIMVGTGPGADNLDEIVSSRKTKPILIAINRAIVLRNDFDYLFVDHFSTLEELRKFTGRAKCVCLPLYSRVDCNLNAHVVQELKDQDRLLIYAWAYQAPDVITNGYVLNNALLYISWGNAQSIIHFAKIVGTELLTVIGCDGGPVNGQTNATKIEEIFGKFKGKEANKRANDYQKTRSRLHEIATLANVRIEIVDHSGVIF